MTLWEFTNGYIGESYVRVYIWAATEERAKELAATAFDTDKPFETCRRLFSANDPEFATKPSDTGFNDEDK